MGDTIFVNYFDSITDQKAKALMAICADLMLRKPTQLYFLFSSQGGSVNAGITLYNYLRALPTEIVMHNTGSIDSIATVIFLAGQKRYAATHSTFLFHGVQCNFGQGSSLNAAQLQERTSNLQQDENKMAGILTGCSKLTDGEVRELFRQGESKDLAFAIDKGIIHEIRDPKVPPDAPFIAVDLN